MPLADIVHDQPGRFLGFVVAGGAAAAEKPPRIKGLALIAQIPVDIGILHGTVDARRANPGEGYGPHADFPVAHMHGHDQGGPHLVFVAADPVAVGHVQTAGVFDDAVDVHRLDHDPAEIVPGGNGDAFTLFGRLFGKRPLEIGQGALVAPVPLAQDPPEESGDIACGVERDETDEADQKTKARIFEPVFQVGCEGGVE
jgi:hypothetical protein